MVSPESPLSHCAEAPLSLSQFAEMAHGGPALMGSSPASWRSSATTPWGGTARAVKLRTAVPLSVCIHKSYESFVNTVAVIELGKDVRGQSTDGRRESKAIR